MNGSDLIAILPSIVVGGTVTIVMLVIAFYRQPSADRAAVLLGLVLSLVAIWPASSVAPRQVTPLFVIDRYALFYMGLIFAASIAVLLLSYGYLAARREPPEEFYLLVLVATLGATALVASDHFASFFLGLETLSISLLGLIAYPRDHGKAARGRRQIPDPGWNVFGIAAIRHGPRLRPPGHPGIRADRGVAEHGQWGSRRPLLANRPRTHLYRDRLQTVRRAVPHVGA